MLDQRRRRWADIAQMLYKCFVFAGTGREESQSLDSRVTGVVFFMPKCVNLLRQMACRAEMHVHKRFLVIRRHVIHSVNPSPPDSVVYSRLELHCHNMIRNHSNKTT